jgi:type II secretory ATPase GspE/PulE/Tfp pilus assembly ATPase PilB-like protein
VLVPDETITVALARGDSAEEITDLAVEKGMRTMIADGMRQVVEGVTTVDEVLRVTSFAL